MYNNVYIDYYPGTHGHFLEFLINRFLFKDPRYANFNPFEKNGRVHQKPNQHNYKVEKVKPSHFSAFDINGILTDFDCVIQINADYHKHSYIWLYNILSRTPISTNYSSTVEDFNTWLINTHYSNYVNNKVSEIRNMIYTNCLHPETYFQSVFKGFKHVEKNFFIFEFDNFFNFDKLSSSIIGISKFLHLDDDIDLIGVRKIWQQFISKSGGHYSKIQVDNFFNSIVNNKNSQCHLNLIEQGYLNSLITKKYNIHAGISIFSSDEYPTSSMLIKKEIDQII